jgi:hypothetical protein
MKTNSARHFGACSWKRRNPRSPTRQLTHVHLEGDWSPSRNLPEGETGAGVAMPRALWHTAL